MHKRIYNGLVVDDEVPIRLATTRALASEGIVCDVAANGSQALDLVRQSKYDVVVTDLRMPETNGHALAVELLGLSKRPLIVVLTGVLEPRLADDLRNRGVDDVQFKPVDFRQFAARVRHLADQRSAAAGQDKERSADDILHAVEAAVSAPLRDRTRQIQDFASRLPEPAADYDAFKALSADSFSMEDVVAAVKQDPELLSAVLTIFNRALYTSDTKVGN